MLAQKIALETNERGALSVARRSCVSMSPRLSGWSAAQAE
jgi:hypothetical protein